MSTIPNTGKIGTTGQRIVSIIPSRHSKIITIIPAKIIVSLANIPTTLDTKRSKNAEMRASSASLLDAPAEICRYGLNNVLSISPNENISAVSPNLLLKFAKNIPHPRKYHQDIRSAKNIPLLYHKPNTFDKIIFQDYNISHYGTVTQKMQ